MRSARPRTLRLAVAAWLVPALMLAAAAPARATLLSLLEVDRNGGNGIEGMNGPEGLAISPDGLNVYVTSYNDSSVAVFRRDPGTGALTFFELQQNGVGGVTMLGGAHGAVVSPDGANVYVTSEVDDALVAFSRDPATGALGFLMAINEGPNNVNGLNGANSITVSPDGRHLYIGTDYNEVTVYGRDPATGLVTFIESQVDGVNGVDGLARTRAVAISSDGATVYSAASDDNAVAAFRRDPATGRLTYLEMKKDGVGGVNGIDHARGVAVSPDAACVYAVGSWDDALAVFSRDRSTGRLAFVEMQKDDTNGVDGLNDAQGVTVSPDGTYVYATGKTDDALAVFRRDPATCRLTFLERYVNNVDGIFGLDGVEPVLVSPDGLNVYTGGFVDDAVSVFRMQCGNGMLDPGEQCDDGNAQNGDCCSSSCTFEAAGTPCDDGSFCTVGDTCAAGGVCHGAARDCSTAVDQCHTATCDDDAGQCVAQPKANGTACTDGNICTQTDTCQAGVCTGANPVTCAAQDQCHNAGTCDPATGACSNPSKPNGTACTDGNACTQADTCQAGVCTGANPVTCAVPDQCHTAGTCNPATGVCSNPSKPNGTACTDGNACTQADTCQAGACTGANPVTCTAQDQCHNAGTCNPSTGVCSNPSKPNGTACTDGNACTQADTCQAGACTSGIAVTCTAQDQCHTAGSCNAATGVCSNPAKADGAACNDGNACTRTDVCMTGTCTGTNPVQCATPDQCQDGGSCDPSTGLCGPAKADGTSCDDHDRCTQVDRCTAGTCHGTPVTCAAPDQCHLAGVCDGSTGLCTNPAKPDGSVCTDGNACTQSDICQGGVCTGADPIVCTAPDTCHEAGTCDSATGACPHPAKPDGTPCGSSAPCTMGSCESAVCVPEPLTCTPQDQCHDAGTCDPSTGQCSNPEKRDGASCDDGDACTIGDSCSAGACTGLPGPDEDQDGVCDAKDDCPEIYDPDQVDADHDGIGDSCECTAPAPGRCIPGGGPKRADCLVEFNTGGPVTYNRKRTNVRRLVRCIDGDSWCDRDGLADGKCTFGIAVCLGNHDPRFPRCTPADMRNFEVIQPDPTTATSSFDLDNAHALERALGSLGLEIRRRGQVITPALAPAGDNTCSRLINLTVPAPRLKGGRPIRRRFWMRGISIDSRRDGDRLILECYR